MTYHLFKESEPGVVTHTAATKALVQVPRLVDWVGMWLEEIVIGLARVRLVEMRVKPVFYGSNVEFRW